MPFEGPKEKGRIREGKRTLETTHLTRVGLFSLLRPIAILGDLS